MRVQCVYIMDYATGNRAEQTGGRGDERRKMLRASCAICVLQTRSICDQREREGQSEKRSVPFLISVVHTYNSYAYHTFVVASFFLFFFLLFTLQILLLISPLANNNSISCFIFILFFGRQGAHSSSKKASSAYNETSCQTNYKHSLYVLRFQFKNERTNREQQQQFEPGEQKKMKRAGHSDTAGSSVAYSARSNCRKIFP